MFKNLITLQGINDVIPELFFVQKYLKVYQFVTSFEQFIKNFKNILNRQEQNLLGICGPSKYLNLHFHLASFSFRLI